MPINVEWFWREWEDVFPDNQCRISNAIIDYVYLFGTEFRNVFLPQKIDGNYKY